ncbi:MAG: hypothetical protein QOH73_229, partial [Gaiellaceae bacterium]|nr:hypothetical protein [Gaiellaceae bacterium]
GARVLARGGSLAEALGALAAALRESCDADAVVLWLPARDPEVLAAHTIEARSVALAAELQGATLPLAELPAGFVSEQGSLPEAVRLAAERAGLGTVAFAAARLGERAVGAVLLLRGGEATAGLGHELVPLAADQLALLVAADEAVRSASGADGDPLALAGHVLSAEGRAAVADELARLALVATGARSCLIWEADGSNEVALVAASPAGAEPPGAAACALRALTESATVLEGDLLTLPLGQPASGALQLELQAGATVGEHQLARLGGFAARAAHALRTAGAAEETALELERTRTLLAVIGEAIAQLSLAHTLSTAAERIAELFGIPRVAAYLLDEEDQLQVAVARELPGPHVVLGIRLLDLALAGTHGRGLARVDDLAAEPRLAEAAAAAGLQAAVALPLLAGNEAIGMVALYPARGRTLSENEQALLRALAAQLAVAVQNAQLHEETKRLGAEREQALAAERQAARQLRALYEISRSFAQSLSLERTLEAVAETVVELLDVDAAVIRMLDERRDTLEAHALSVSDVRLAGPLRTILTRPLPLTSTLARVFRDRAPLRITPETIGALGEPVDPLLPFLEHGSTAIILPIATPAEVLATLTLVSLDPDRQLDDSTVASALAIAGQAALAIDNARLYQQQKLFADTMQRSLLPRAQPEVEGLDVGAVYESDARVDVGGDLYDYLLLDDHRLAVVLGDVTGHGIDATADMAMAKFVFRSLAREHSQPGEFLAAANDVVASEVAAGKFITMLYLTVDADRGEIACAGGGHPPPRLILPDGTVESIEVRGLVLGIEPGQVYEEIRLPFPIGSTVVLYTDGVVEAREGHELFGDARLDATLAAVADQPAERIAQEVLEACRAFAGGELGDDCAIVVIKRTA